MNARVRLPSDRRQRGFSLIVSLMMLIVITILGVSASQMAINEERGSRNDRDRQIAFQAAEAALNDAELEILGPLASRNAATGNCADPSRPNRGWSRSGFPNTCFNALSRIGFATGGCSAGSNMGLCDYDATCPAWLRFTTSSNVLCQTPGVEFAKDAQGSGPGTTVEYGKFTGAKFASQQTSSAYTTQPLSKYPPRYIIERVPRNTSVNSLSGEQPYMFRVTAMGFGANPDTQVVLQTTVATKDTP